MDTVSPEGAEAVSVMVEVKPAMLVSEIVVLEDVPLLKVRLEGLAEVEKSGAGTVRKTVIERGVSSPVATNVRV